MARLKGPVPLIGMLAVLTYAAVVLTEPTPPASQPNNKSKKSRAATETVDPRSLVRFGRYQAAGRDGFTPLVVVQKAGAFDGPTLASGGGGTWALTGISATNGVTSALLENGSTHDTVFVRRGEQWNGLTVLAIEPTEVVFRDKQGRDKRITFAVPVAEVAKQATTAASQSMQGPGFPGGFAAPAPSQTTPDTGRRATSERQGN